MKQMMFKDYRSRSSRIVGCLALILTIALFCGFSGIANNRRDQADGKTGIANPASVNCIEKGGTLSDLPVEVERPPLIPGKSIGNLHMHTTCSDGKNGYEEMVQKALGLNFRFMAVTDHVYGGSAPCEEVIRKCRNEKRLLCIPGMEVTGRVHLLAIGIHQGIHRNLPVERQVEEIHRQGGIAIAAHPFRMETPYTEAELFETRLDAIECRDIPEGKQAAFFEKLRERSIPCVSNSDAHDVAAMASRWTICDGGIRGFDDLKAAIKEKRCGW